MKAQANKGFHNGKATLDNGWGAFTDMLAYKQEARGHYLIKVGWDFPSTQRCSTCGYINHDIAGAEHLNIRKWDCPVCGTHHDRDHNAALNILDEGIRLLATMPSERTPKPVSKKNKSSRAGTARSYACGKGARRNGPKPIAQSSTKQEARLLVAG